MYFILSIILILFGISIFFDPSAPITIFGIPKGSDVTFIKWEIGTAFIVCGLLVLYSVLKKTKEQLPEYSKCPQCKTAYDYQKLDKGMCPKCNIPTIDMDEYFKQFPDELKDENKSKCFRSNGKQ